MLEWQNGSPLDAFAFFQNIHKDDE